MINPDFTDVAYENSYVCTLLAQAQTHKKIPEFSMSTCSVMLDFITVKFKIRFDALSIIGIEGDVRLELICERERRYSHWVYSNSKFRPSFWKENKGRIPEFEMVLIKDETQWPDIYINVQTYNHTLRTFQNVNFIRSPWKNFIVQGNSSLGIHTKKSRPIFKPLTKDVTDIVA